MAIYNYNSLNYKLLSITLAGTIAAAAGMLHILLNKKGRARNSRHWLTVDPLLMLPIIVIGTLTRPMIGASGLTILDTFLRDSRVKIGSLTLHIAETWSILLGCIIIAVVIVFPQSVVGTLGRWMNRFRQQSR